MKTVLLKDLATIEISNVDKKSKDGEQPVVLCNFVDVYYNWAITKSIATGFMKATANQNQIERFSIHKGQVAITKDSETRDDIGVAVYIADEIADCVLGYHCALISPNESLLKGKYLNIILHSPYAQKYFEANASGSGQRYTLTTDIIGNFPVPLPDDIAIQENFGELCSNIDAKIENNNAIYSNLEAMAKLLYDYWFVQFDFPDENGKPYKSSGGKMVWNEDLKREIPAGWEVGRIGDMITTERGISYSTPNIKTGNGVPMLNLATFMPGGGSYKADGLKHYLGDYPKNKVLKPFELIMCNTQQTAIKFETDIIGRTMLVPDIFAGDVVFSHHVNVIRTIVEDMKYYLLFLFNSDYYHKYISGFTNGTNILGLSFNGVEDYLVEIPSTETLKAFGERILGMERKKSEIILENQQLASLRDFLLPMLMNGQVKVGKVGA